MAVERWKRIRDWPYIVSDRGRVARFTAAQGTRKGQIIKPKITFGGYARVCLRKAGERCYVRVHRLVAQAFIDWPRGRQINHKNGNKLDNRVENLEWVTGAENMQHASEHGMRPRGERHKLSKLDDQKVREIRRRASEGETPIYIAERYEIDPSVVRRVIARKAWKHVQ